MERFYELKVNPIKFQNFTYAFIVNQDNLILANNSSYVEYLIQEDFENDFDHMLLLVNRNDFKFPAVTKVEYVDSIQKFLVISENKLILTDNKFNVIKQLSTEVTDFWAEEKADGAVFCCIVFRNGHISIFSFNNGNSSLKLLHNIQDLKISTGALSFPLFCYYTGSEYGIVNWERNDKKSLFPFKEAGVAGTVCKVEEGQFLLLGPSSLGIFCSENGPMPKNSLTLPQNLASLSVIEKGALLVARTDEFFIFYSTQTGEQIETFQVVETNPLVAFNQDMIILFGCGVKMFGSPPWFQQAKKLILSGNLDKVIEIKNQEIERINELSLRHPDAIELIQHRFTTLSRRVTNLIGFVHLHQADFKSAFDSFIEGDLDPRELLVRYEGLLAFDEDYKSEPFYHFDQSKPLVSFQALCHKLAKMEANENMEEEKMATIEKMVIAYLKSNARQQETSCLLIDKAILELTLKQFAYEKEQPIDMPSLYNMIRRVGADDFDFVRQLLITDDRFSYILGVHLYTHRDVDRNNYFDAVSTFWAMVKDQAGTKEPFSSNPMALVLSLVASPMLTFFTSPLEFTANLKDDFLLRETPYDYSQANFFMTTFSSIVKFSFNQRGTWIRRIAETLTDYLPYLKLRLVNTENLSKLLSSEAVLAVIAQDEVLTNIYFLSVLELTRKVPESIEVYENALAVLVTVNADIKYRHQLRQYALKNRIKRHALMIEIMEKSQNHNPDLSFEKALVYSSVGDYESALDQIGTDYPTTKEFIEALLGVYLGNPSKASQVHVIMSCIVKRFIANGQKDDLINLVNEFGEYFDITETLDTLADVEVKRLIPGLTRTLGRVAFHQINAEISKTLVQIDADQMCRLNMATSCVVDQEGVLCCECDGKIDEADPFVVDKMANLVFHESCHEKSLKD